MCAILFTYVQRYDTIFVRGVLLICVKCYLGIELCVNVLHNQKIAAVCFLFVFTTKKSQQKTAFKNRSPKRSQDAQENIRGLRQNLKKKASCWTVDLQKRQSTTDPPLETLKSLRTTPLKGTFAGLLLVFQCFKQLERRSPIF